MNKVLSTTFYEREVLRQALSNHIELCKRLLVTYSDISEVKQFCFERAVTAKVLYFRLFHLV